MSYFVLFKDVDDYGHYLREFETEAQVIEWLDDNCDSCGYEDVKVIVGKSLEVTKKHELEKH